MSRMIKTVMVVGAGGFIGSHIARRLIAEGYQVVAMGRKSARLAELAPVCTVMAVDPVALATAKDWLACMKDVDAVINCVGAFKDTTKHSLRDVHAHLPERLVEACARSPQTKRFIHMSALGADEHAVTPFLSTKGQGDAAIEEKARILAWPHWTVVRASVVAGEGGGSSRLFSTLAAQPIEFLIPDALGFVQPIHIDDLTGVIHCALESTEAEERILVAAGPRRMTMTQYFKILRTWQGLGDAPKVPVPLSAMWWSAWLGQFVPGSLLTPDALKMLASAQYADPVPAMNATGYTVRSLERALWQRPISAGSRTRVQLEVPMIAMRIVLALLWLSTAVVSLWIYPRAESLLLLDATPLPQSMHTLALIGASLWDAAMGGLLLMGLWNGSVLWLQIITIIIFSVIIAAYLPEFYAHPFAPILKNGPLLATIAVLIVWESRK